MESYSRMASGRSLLRPRRRTEPGVARPTVPILAAFALVFAVSAASQEEARSGILLDRFLDEVTTLRADFEQRVALDDDVETQSGWLALERPSRFRWHYEEPFEQLIVADGKNLWIHDVELEQASVTPLDDAVASTPAMLLSGDDAVREGFTVVDEYDDGTLSWLRLEPNVAGSEVQSVLLGFDDLVPRRLEFVNGLGQVTAIVLSNVEINVELDDGLFRFDRPRGVDLIGRPAR